MLGFKCRGKQLGSYNNGMWRYGCYVFSIGNQNAHCIIDECGNSNSVDPKTIGFYPGMRDMNGVQICEHDIVRLIPDVCQTFFLPEYGVIECSNGTFYIGKEHELRSSICCVADFNYVLRGEVIGNIFDNPELVEKYNLQ